MMADPQPEFIPKPGQVDFTDVRWCPVINCILFYKDKFLLVKRNPNMRLYPGYWNGISGFLDDKKSLAEKVYEELSEELGLSESQISSIELKGIFDQEAQDIGKTWIVHAVKVAVTTDVVKLDWEATEYRWVIKDELSELQLLPGLDEVLTAVHG